MNVHVPTFPSCCRSAWLAAHSWHTSAPSPWVVRAVAMGYCLQFRVKRFCFCRMINTAVCKEAAVILKEEISALLQKRAIQVVLNTETAFECSWPERLIDRSINNRSKTCYFLCGYTPEPQALSEVCVRGRILWIPGAAVQVVSCSLQMCRGTISTLHK